MTTGPFTKDIQKRGLMKITNSENYKEENFKKKCGEVMFLTLTVFYFLHCDSGNDLQEVGYDLSRQEKVLDVIWFPE